MKKLLFLSMFVVCACNAYANNDAYQREWRENLFHDTFYIRLFHIGGTLCDKFRNIWSEKCQDALLEDVYGPVWPEIKTILLDFQKAVVENDYKYLKGKTTIPKNTLFVRIDTEPPVFDKIPSSPMFKVSRLIQEKQITTVFLHLIPDELKEVIKNTKYEDIIFDKWSETMRFEWRAKDIKSYASCGISFKYILNDKKIDSYSSTWIHLPEIRGLYLDLKYYKK